MDAKAEVAEHAVMSLANARLDIAITDCHTLILWSTVNSQNVREGETVANDWRRQPVISEMTRIALELGG